MTCGTASAALAVLFTSCLRFPPACLGCSSRHLQRSDGNCFRIALVHSIPEFVSPLGDACRDLAIAARSEAASSQRCDQDRVNRQRSKIVVGAYHDAFTATFVMLVRAMSLLSKSRSKQTIEPPAFALANE